MIIAILHGGNVMAVNPAVIVYVSESKFSDDSDGSIILFQFKSQIILADM